MATVTDNLDIARQALVDTDEVTAEEIGLRSVPISFEEEGDRSWATMEVEGQPIQLSDYALKQLAAEVGVPTSYVLKCPAELQASNLEYWQRHLTDRKRSNLIIGLGQIQAVTSPNFTPVSNVRLFDALVERVSKGDESKLTLDAFEHDWLTTRIALTHADSSHEVTNHYLKELNPGAQEGDIVRAGVNLVNSLVNETHTEISPFALRLVCINRMVSPVLGGDGASLEDYRLPRDGSVAALDWIARSIDAIGEQLEPMFAAMDDAAQRVLDDPQRVLRDQLNHVPGPMRESVIEAYGEEPAPTAWGIANALTRAATHSESGTSAHRSRMERRAGWYISTSTCDACGAPLGNHGAH